MVKSPAKKFFITDVLKSALISILVGAIFILIFATVLNFVPVNDKIVTVINQSHFSCMWGQMIFTSHVILILDL